MTFAIVGLLAGVVLAGVPHTRAALPELGADWKEVRSEGVVVLSDHSSRDSGRIASRVRRFRRDVFGPGRPFRAADSDSIKVFLFADKDLLRWFEPRGSVIFQPIEGLSYIGLARDRWEESLRTALSMEALHLLGEASPGIPAWLRRGLATFYSTYRFDGGRGKVGHRVDHMFDVLRQGTPLPWARVLELGWFSPEQDDPEKRRMFAAQSWILAHYVVTETDAGEQGVARYVAQLDAGAERDTAFREVFGFARSTLPERASQYARGRGFDPIALRPPSEDDRTLVIMPSPSRAWLLAELGEMIANLDSGTDTALAGERHAMANELLREALKIDSDLSAAHRGLGTLQLRQNDAAGSLPHLRRAVQRDPSDLRARLLLARALLEPYSEKRVSFSIRRKDPPRAIAEARKELLECLALDPDFTDVHVLLGQTYLHDPGDPAPGIRTLRGILPRSPGRTDILFPLVLLLLKAGQVDMALPMLDPGDDTDPEWQRIRKAAEDGAEASDGPGGRPLAAGEADRQYAEYLKALELSSEKKYKKAMAILTELVAQPNDEDLHDSIVQLWDQVRYNRALTLFGRGKYEAALELARETRKTTSQPAIRDRAKALAKNCRRAMEK